MVCWEKTKKVVNMGNKLRKVTSNLYKIISASLKINEFYYFRVFREKIMNCGKCGEEIKRRCITLIHSMLINSRLLHNFSLNGKLSRKSRAMRVLQT